MENFYKTIKGRTLTIKEKVNVQLKPKEPFNSFYEQEINEQPETLLRCMGNGARLASFMGMSEG